MEKLPFPYRKRDNSSSKPGETGLGHLQLRDENASGAGRKAAAFPRAFAPRLG